MRAFIISFAILAGCSPYDPGLAAAPFLCGPAPNDAGSGSGGACPDGFACTGSDGSGRPVCVEIGGKQPDAASQNGMCADDSAIRGQGIGSIATAYMTPVETGMRKNVSYAGLSICPAGTKETFQITLTSGAGNAAMQNIDVTVQYDTWGAPLQGELLNQNGIPIAPMSPDGQQNEIHASGMSLPTGQYYAQVFANANGINNYRLTIAVTP